MKLDIENDQSSLRRILEKRDKGKLINSLEQYFQQVELLEREQKKVPQQQFQCS